MNCIQVCNLLLTLKLKENSPFFIFFLITSTWYCKLTDSGPIINYLALAPKRYERSVMEGFLHRVCRACTSWANFHDSMEKISITY